MAEPMKSASSETGPATVEEAEAGAGADVEARLAEVQVVDAKESAARCGMLNIGDRVNGEAELGVVPPAEVRSLPSSS
jgi:hypothetical protein